MSSRRRHFLGSSCANRRGTVVGSSLWRFVSVNRLSILEEGSRGGEEASGQMRRSTSDSPFAQSFFTLVEELGVVPV